MAKSKERKLSYTDQRTLRGLEEEERDLNRDATSKIEEIGEAFSKFRAEATRKAADRVGEVAKSASRNKKRIDARKVVELERVEEAYQKELDANRSVKRDSLDSIEEALERAVSTIDIEMNEKIQKVNDSLQETLKENHAQQYLIRHGALSEETTEEQPMVEKAAEVEVPHGVQ